MSHICETGPGEHREDGDMKGMTHDSKYHTMRPTSSVVVSIRELSCPRKQRDIRPVLV